MEQPEKQFIQQLDQFIAQHIGDAHFTIEDICQELGLSRSQLFRLLKEHTALSPSRYIRQHRLQKAKELLESTDLRIVEIAAQVGFDSQQTFSKFFTEDFGFNPTEYRKNRLNTVKTVAVQPQEPTTQFADLQPIQEQAPALLVSPQYKYMGLALLAVVLLVAGFYLWKNVKAAEPTHIEADNAIVVLPFKSESNPESMLLADGVSEQVHASLAALENLKVISKNSSQLLKDSKKTIPQIASELHVAYVLDGTVTQTGERMRVSIELVKAADDQVVWAQHYEGKAPEAIDFINQIAKEIANQLQQKLARPLNHQLAQIPTKNLKAYNEYLKGKQLMLTRTKEKLEASIKRFDQAIVLDPSFADAYAYKASAYHILGSSTFIESQLSIRLAEQNALIAIQLDAQNGMAYAVLANVYREQNKWEQAITTYQIALKYSPNDAQINYWYSIALRSVGEFDKAIEYSTKAIALDPLYPTILFGHIGNCSYAGKYKLAQQSIQEGQALFSDFYMFYYVRGFYYLNLGDYQSALRDFKTSDSMSPNTKSIESYITYCQGKLGQQAAVKTYLASLSPTPDNYDWFAIAYAGLNDKEQCFHYLQLAAAQGHLPEYFKVSPFFKFLHGDKRFNELLQQFGLLNFKLST
ncbi:MAG: helix-turn-helix domain-containing protein [Spirosomataceae bacterium]